MKKQPQDAAAHPDEKIAGISVKPCYVYVLGSWTDCDRGGSPRTYTGWTHDVEARLARHNNGTGAKATRGRQWVVLYSAAYKTRGAAMSGEAEMKKRLRQDPAFRQTLLSGKKSST